VSATIIALAGARLPDRREPERTVDPALLGHVERHRAKIAAIKNSSHIAKMDEAIFAAIDAHCDAIAAYHACTYDDESERAFTRMDELTHELLRYRAITAPGILALLDHLAAPEFLYLNPKEGTGETILSGAIEVDDLAKEFPRLLATMLRNSVGTFRTKPVVDEAGSPR
jgi:hypothetical protein